MPAHETTDPHDDRGARATDAVGEPTDADIARARARNDRMMMRALLIAVGVGIVIDAIVIALAATAGGEGALNGALVGSALALVVTLPTLAGARISRSLPPMAWATVLMGSWMVKMFVLIIALLLLRDAEWMARGWLGIALLAGAIAAAVTEAVQMVRSRPRLEVAGPGGER
ncbi:hypothetical protein ACXET9_06855 [Brachybacterium sp. DNPG3]